MCPRRRVVSRVQGSFKGAGIYQRLFKVLDVQTLNGCSKSAGIFTAYKAVLRATYGVFQGCRVQGLKINVTGSGHGLRSWFKVMH